MQDFLETTQRLSKRFESLYYLKLFRVVGELKSSVKAGLLKPFRKVIAVVAATTPISKFSTKVGAKIASANAKVTAKLGAKGVLAAKVFSKVALGVINVGLGIWDIVDGVNALEEGNEQAQQFREESDKLEELNMVIVNQFTETMIELGCTQGKIYIKKKLEWNFL